MKKIIILTTFLISSFFSFAQSKDTSKPIVKDTAIAITITLNDFKLLLFKIDQNIDSKIITKELLDFLQKNARIHLKISLRN